MLRRLMSSVLMLGLGWGLDCASAQAATPRDTVVMAKQIDFLISLDPAEAFEVGSGEVVGNLYDKLLSYDYANPADIRGALAESWDASPDGRMFTFHIRPGVSFSSGNPLTAADAAFSLQRVVKLAKSPAFILQQFGFTAANVDERIHASDERTLTIQIDHEVSPSFFYYCLTAQAASIVDAREAQAHDTGGDLGNDWLRSHSAGSGPFRLLSWKPNESYTLEANPKHWATPPKTARIAVRHVAEAAAQRLLLEKGDVDYARNLERDQLAGLEKNPAIRFDRGVQSQIMYLGLNQKRPILAKPEVREALKYLVDYRGIEANLLKGTRTVHQGFLPEGYLGAIKDEPYKLDIARAKSLLGAAGLPDGFSITMDVRNVSPFTDVAQAIQATFAQAGIKLELIPGDGKQTLTKYRARNHDIYIGDWGSDYQDPNSNAEAFATNPDNGDDAKAKTLAWRNAWDIPDLNRLSFQALIERDPVQRGSLYEALQRRHQAEAPFVVMFEQVEVAAHRAEVDGLVLGPTNLLAGIAKR